VKEEKWEKTRGKYFRILYCPMKLEDLHMYQNFWLVIRFIFYMMYLGTNLRLSHSVAWLEPQSSGERVWRLENP